MNENVIKAANALAIELAKSEEIINLQKSREAYTHNAELSKLATEYMVQSAAMEEELKKGDDADKDLMVAIKDRMMQISAQLNESADIIALRNAEEVASVLLNEVNSILSAAISGEEGGCGHDCSHCSGCH